MFMNWIIDMNGLKFGIPSFARFSNRPQKDLVEVVGFAVFLSCIKFDMYNF